MSDRKHDSEADRLEGRGAARLVLSPNVQAVLLAVALLAVGIATIWFTPDADAPIRSAENWFPLAVALMFGASIVVVFHVEFRREAFTFSLSEVPISIAVVFLIPVEGVAARVAGTLVAVLLFRRPPLVKLLFNLSAFIFEVAIAYAITHALLSGNEPSDARIVFVVTGAVIVASLAGSVAVSVAISRFEGDTRNRVLVDLKSSWVFVVNSAAAGMVLGLALQSGSVAVIAIVPVTALWALVRGNGAISQRLRDLDEVHGFTSRIGKSLDLDEVCTTAVADAARILRADVAVLRLARSDGSVTAFSFGTPGDGPAIAIDDPWWPLIAEDPTTRAIDDDEIPSRLRTTLGAKPQLAVSPVADDAGTIGTLVIAGPTGAEKHFDDRNVQHLQNLAEQLATSLRKALLHERVEYEARHDTLTGLPNRNAFEGHITDRMDEKYGRPGQYVMMLDLDRFKEVNDTLGHHAGDDLLIEFSRRVAAEIGDDDNFARLAGDEFAIVLKESDDDAALDLAARCRDAASRPILLDGLSVVVTASVGIAEFVDADRDAVGPMRRADVAMYNAKSHHLGIELYRPELDRRTPARLSMLGDLREAIEEGHLGIEFQPKLDLASGVITGAEALVRWTHAVRGVVAPSEFIRVAEETGLIKQLTDLMLANGISELRKFHERGHLLGLSVNLSTHDLVDANLAERVRAHLEANGVEPGSLTLEITESSLLIDGPRARATIDDLHALGVRLAIDDFGTGYSSLSYLRQLPVRELKIDQSFITNLLTDEQDEVIVRSTIDLGHNLGLEVVAEGVESEAVLERLRSFGCDVAQGFCISRPLTSRRLLSWLATTEHPSQRNDPLHPEEWIAQMGPDERR
ncbi:MAG: bifunctional diguanylate cyclase/phosphodiesterase [Ilumatobacter sp.]|uniref:putative bifunctional diguanylate cyclase/phosphodiesterase n=1 Tax=Ilumatobacter sp. TaxID=1967498 RepID=UPI003C782183